MRGVTLVELMIGVIIIGILAAMVILAVGKCTYQDGPKGMQRATVTTCPAELPSFTGRV